MKSTVIDGRSSTGKGAAAGEAWEAKFSELYQAAGFGMPSAELSVFGQGHGEHQIPPEQLSTLSPRGAAQIGAQDQTSAARPTVTVPLAASGGRGIHEPSHLFGALNQHRVRAGLPGPTAENTSVNSPVDSDMRDYDRGEGSDDAEGGGGGGGYLAACECGGGG
mmetsp:Transcript_38287/g.94835  ORF Transcript_38287/g.94835 Transcript_38287/m.94835 type:complete len:164 (-) Transcript_38287:679-1170(-)